MALLTKVRGEATFVLAVGASCLLVALWDVSDQTFGSSWSRDRYLIRAFFAWLFDTFGHWGLRVPLMAFGVFLVASSFRVASVAREKEEPSNESRTLNILSWVLIVLVLSFLLFIVVGPLLQDPRIDDTIDHWREKYFSAAAFVTIALAWLYSLWLNWQRYRETGDPYHLLRIVLYTVLAIVIGVLVAFGGLWRLGG
jgi:hypothetical protein